MIKTENPHVKNKRVFPRSTLEIAPTFSVSPSVGDKQMGLPQQVTLSIDDAIQRLMCCSTFHLETKT